MKRRLSFILILALALVASACGNLYSSLANKTTDDAIYESVLQAVDDKDWATALAQINSLSAAKKTEPAVIETWAGIYAGQCGLDFITYFDTISNASLTGSTILKYLMNALTQQAVDPPSCLLAQQKIEEISTDPAQRTEAQNLFVAVLGMVKVGVYLRSNADVDSTGNLGDGSIDAGYNSCQTTSISDADVTQVITGMGLVITNLSSITSVITGGSLSSSLTTISATCGSLCQKTDSADVTGSDITLLRDLLRTGPSTTDPNYQFGIDDACNPSSGATLLACCP
jgi:hypothetical protein